MLLEQLIYRCSIWFDKFSTYLNDYVSLQRISFENRQKRKIHIQSHYKAHAAITVIHYNSQAAITVMWISQYIEV